MWIEFRLYQWIAEGIANLFASKIVDGEHQEPDESDWSWETDLKETGLDLESDEVPRFFAILSRLFDRGFGPPQIEIIRNLVGRLRPGEARQLDFNPGRKGKPVTLQILLASIRAERIQVVIRSSPALVKAIETLIESTDFSRHSGSGEEKEEEETTP